MVSSRVLLLAASAVLLLASQSWAEVDSELGEYSSAAIAIDARPCAQIGMDVIRRGGNAVDSAIAALFCDGLFNAYAMGVGGGLFMTVYIRATGEVVHMDARESAPAYASPDMYQGNEDGSSRGPDAAGVPSEVLGLWEAKQRYGDPAVSWSSLLQPSIDMCYEGIEVGFSLAANLQSYSDDIKADPGLSDVFVNPATGEVWREGDLFVWPTLGATLQRTANNGGEEFRSGQTAVEMIADMQAAGGRMELQDLLDYTVVWEDPVSVDLGDGLVLYSSPPPGSGVVLGYILNILQNYDLTPADAARPVTYQRIAEAFKWGYARRSELGDPMDPDYGDAINELALNMTSEQWAFDAFSQINDTATSNETSYYGAAYDISRDFGTSHVAIIAPNGDAISATSTHNLQFGAKFMSPSTGVILNNEMDDFSYPGQTNEWGVEPSPSNYPIPGKRPMSSMAPAVVVDANTGDIRLVTGSAGGTQITTSIAYTSLRNLWFGENVKEAIDSRRPHHQLLPMELTYEDGFDQSNLDYLESCGHALVLETKLSVVCKVGVAADGTIQANADGRKDGGVDGF